MRPIQTMIQAACMAALATILFCSCNQISSQQTEAPEASVNRYYAPATLRSEAIAQLADYNTSKKKLVALVSDLAVENFNSADFQITDIYLYPDFKGVEIFYKLPNDAETNALLVSGDALDKIEICSDQVEIPLKNGTDSKVILEDGFLLETDETISIQSIATEQTMLFTCDNPNDCDPCKVIIARSETVEPVKGESKTTVRCGSCEGCSLKVEITE